MVYRVLIYLVCFPGIVLRQPLCCLVPQELPTRDLLSEIPSISQALAGELLLTFTAQVKCHFFGESFLHTSLRSLNQVTLPFSLSGLFFQSIFHNL